MDEKLNRLAEVIFNKIKNQKKKAELESKLDKIRAKISLLNKAQEIVNGREAEDGIAEAWYRLSLEEVKLRIELANLNLTIAKEDLAELEAE